MQMLGDVGMCVTGFLCVPADGESLEEREVWKDDSEDIVGRDTPTDHEPLKRDEPQVSVCVCVHFIWHLFQKGKPTALSMQPCNPVECCFLPVLS